MSLLYELRSGKLVINLLDSSGYINNKLLEIQNLFNNNIVKLIVKRDNIFKYDEIEVLLNPYIFSGKQIFDIAKKLEDIETECNSLFIENNVWRLNLTITR